MQLLANPRDISEILKYAQRFDKDLKGIAPHTNLEILFNEEMMGYLWSDINISKEIEDYPARPVIKKGRTKPPLENSQFIISVDGFHPEARTCTLKEKLANCFLLQASSCTDISGRIKIKDKIELIDEISSCGMKLIFATWYLYEKESDTIAGYLEFAEKAKTTLGKDFIAWVGVGEIDTGYFWDNYAYVKKFPKEFRFNNRKEGYERYWRYVKEEVPPWFKDRVLTTPFIEYVERLEEIPPYISFFSALSTAHYNFENGARINIQEVGENLPNVQILAAFNRGAARQYDGSWGFDVSTWYWWTTNIYPGCPSEDKIKMSISGGHSLQLLRKIYYYTYLSGADILHYEGSSWSHFVADKSNSFQLSPLGKVAKEVADFVFKKFPHRGEPYSPIAIMLDFYHGWVPPFYRGKNRRNWGGVWCGIPFGKREWMLDSLFKFLFPGCEYSGSPLDEKGYLTGTRFGDIFDVILSNAGFATLERYKCIILARDTKLSKETQNNLVKYVEKGRKLVVSPPNDNHLPKDIRNRVFYIEDKYMLNERGDDLSPQSKNILKEAIFPYMMVHVDNFDIHFSLTLHSQNISSIFLMNNSGADWQGKVSIKRETIKDRKSSFKDLISGKEYQGTLQQCWVNLNIFLPKDEVMVLTPKWEVSTCKLLRVFPGEG